MNNLKGKTIICAFPIVDEVNDWIGMFKKWNVSWTEDDDKYFVEGIVPDDTDELGISVVAQDNSKWCMVHIQPWVSEEEKTPRIAMLKQGYYNFWVKPFGIYGNGKGRNPTCPYGGK